MRLSLGEFHLPMEWKAYTMLPKQHNSLMYSAKMLIAASAADSAHHPLDADLTSDKSGSAGQFRAEVGVTHLI